MSKIQEARDEIKRLEAENKEQSLEIANQRAVISSLHQERKRQIAELERRIDIVNGHRRDEEESAEARYSALKKEGDEMWDKLMKANAELHSLKLEHKVMNEYTTKLQGSVRVYRELLRLPKEV